MINYFLSLLVKKNYFVNLWILFLSILLKNLFINSINVIYIVANIFSVFVESFFVINSHDFFFINKLCVLIAVNYTFEFLKNTLYL